MKKLGPPKRDRELQTEWKIDAFLKELLDLGVDYAVRINSDVVGQVSFTLYHRHRLEDIAILHRCLLSSFGIRIE